MKEDQNTHFSKHILDAAIQLDEITRRNMIKTCHALETQFMSIVPHFECMMSAMHAEIEARFQYLKDNNRSPLQGIEKLAIGFGIDDTLVKGSQNNKLKYDILNAISKMQELRLLMVSNTLNNETIVEALKHQHTTFFKKVCWHHNIRTLFYAKLSALLVTFNKLCKRVNSLIKSYSDDSHIGTYAYKEFLINVDAHPLKEESKQKIVDAIKPLIDEISMTLEVDFYEHAENIIVMLSSYQQYVDIKNEVILSVIKYPAYLAKRQNFKRNDAHALDCIVSKTAEQISQILYKFKDEHNFIPFVHSYCQHAISSYVLENKLVINNKQMENKRRAIYQGVADVTVDCQHIDFELLSRRVQEIDPNAVFSAEQLENYVNGSKISSLDTGSFFKNDTDDDHDKEILWDERENSEEQLLSEEVSNTLIEAINLLPEIQRKIFVTHFYGKNDEHKIARLAEKHNLTYDQIRGNLANSKLIIKNHMRSKFGIGDQS